MRTNAIQGAAACLLALLPLTSCTTHVSSNEFNTKSIASAGRGPTTYEQAVNAEADRLLKLDTSLTPGAATRQAKQNLATNFYQEDDPFKNIEESHRQKQVAAQVAFEDDFAKTMRK